MKLFQSRLQSQQAEWSRTGKLSIGHVLHKYLTRICRIDYKSEYKLPFSLCFLSKKKLKSVLGYFDEVISVTVAIQQAEWSRTGKLSIGNVLPKYLTRICRIDYKRE